MKIKKEVEIFYRINGFAHSLPLQGFPVNLEGLEDFELDSILTKAFSWAIRAVQLNPEWVRECKKEQKKSLEILQRKLKKIRDKRSLLQKKSRRTPQEAFFLLNSEIQEREIERSIGNIKLALERA